MRNINHIFERIENKKSDYFRYSFTHTENNALKTFFDISQELDGIEDFYDLCVAIPKSFFNMEACLYVIDPKLGFMTLVSKTEGRETALLSPAPEYLTSREYPYHTEDKSLILTIRGKRSLIDQLPFHIEDDVLGLLQIFYDEKIGQHGELFFVKYANRIGFNIHNRFLVDKNIEHLRFIRSLVADIEHNIIVPNMVYKLFLKGLRRKIEKNIEMEMALSEKALSGNLDNDWVENYLQELADVNNGLITELTNIEKHFKNLSLFIETLFRKSHFDEGQLTLRTKPCNIKKDVVQPQLERYIDQFKSMGISVDDRFSGIPDAEIVTVVDIGLIAQVYANLFSNAVKYTQEVTIDTGEIKKYISYGREIINDFFGLGMNGLKLNVFSTGPHIDEKERGRLFEDTFRGNNASDKPGTGHGLSFIKNAVEIHGGVVGYEPTRYGNNFYFILPK